MREYCGSADARNEGAFPIPAIGHSDVGDIAGRHPILARDQTPAEQPGRLHGHADPFGDDGVRLAGDVAGEKDSVREGAANSGMYGTSRKPRTVKLGAMQGGACAFAVLQNVQKRSVRRAAPRVVPAVPRPHIAPKSARATDAAPPPARPTPLAPPAQP